VRLCNPGIVLCGCIPHIETVRKKWKGGTQGETRAEKKDKNKDQKQRKGRQDEKTKKHDDKQRDQQQKKTRKMAEKDSLTFCPPAGKINAAHFFLF
jgi:hypothetical protein